MNGGLKNCMYNVLKIGGNNAINTVKDMLKFRKKIT